MDLFRLYDIRGVYSKTINENVAEKLGKALGTFLKGRGDICVGYDTRTSSSKLMKKLVDGLISTGCNVINLGMIPNPFSYFFAWKHKIFGVYITASHNPANWNGFKFFKPNGTSFTFQELRKLKNLYNQKKFIHGNGKLLKKDVKKEYTKFLKEKIPKLNGKVAIDFLGGAGFTAKNSLEKMGLKLISIHEKPDANFYGFHRLEPWGNLLRDLKYIVKKRSVNFGVAYDADADRAVFVDDKGRWIDPSIIGYLLIESILKRRKGKIVVTFDCASELENFSEKLGGKVIRSRIGHNFIEQKIIKEKALLAIEESSHFYLSEFYPFSDGILATLYLAKLLEGKKLSELTNKIKINPIDRFYINVHNDKTKRKIIRVIKSRYPRALNIKDGIKMWLNKSEWVIIRSSATLPEINICIQAKNRERLQKLRRKFTDYILRLKSRSD